MVSFPNFEFCGLYKNAACIKTTFRVVMYVQRHSCFPYSVVVAIVHPVGNEQDQRAPTNERWLAHSGGSCMDYKAACTPILSRKWPGGGHRALETGNGPLIRKCASPKDPFTDSNPKARVVWQGPECDLLLWPLSGDAKYFGWIV